MYVVKSIPSVTVGVIGPELAVVRWGTGFARVTRTPEGKFDLEYPLSKYAREAGVSLVDVEYDDSGVLRARFDGRMAFTVELVAQA